MDLKREIRNTQNLWEVPKRDKEIIFYSEGKNYYPYFEGLLKELTKHGKSPIYITSDPNEDRGFYIDKLLSFFMVHIDCKVFVMTLTDLNKFHLRRSMHKVHYVYIFHSPISTHMIYRFGAFDHYDSILCVGPHQINEIRKSEELYRLKPKELVEAGYYRLEKLYEASQGHTINNQPPVILIAPTWGPFFESYGDSLIEILLREGYEVILRLHPETIKRHSPSSRNGVTLEISIVDMDSLVRSDVLITDWSGIGAKYTFGTEKPVLFIDTSPKVRNKRYKELGIEPVEVSLRNKVGVVVSPNELDKVPEIIKGLLRGRSAYKEEIIRLREKYIYNFGHSSEVGAKYIMELL